MFHLAHKDTTFCEWGVGISRALFEAEERGLLTSREAAITCSYCDRDEALSAAATLARFGFLFEVVEGRCPSYGISDYDNGEIGEI